MITLALDASTYVGDVAVLDGQRLLGEESVAMKGAEHERLMPAVAATLGTAGVAVDQIERVVCGAGPGSFTSLRIAGAISKGIASGLGVPLYAIPSMALMLAGSDLPAGRYLTIVDALRDEVYVALYELGVAQSLTELECARLVSASEVNELATEYGAVTVSPSKQLASVLAHPRGGAVRYLEDFLRAAGPVDVGAWEPAYGRLAEAQVRWESTHGKALPTG
jgi:tRNA threonylcarbamoyladenosine biosynthesis protein TsaB